MKKQQKFILFVQTILAARQIKEDQALNILLDAMQVTENEAKNANLADFVNWRITWVNKENLFESAPKWLTIETISKILVG